MRDRFLSARFALRFVRLSLSAILLLVLFAAASPAEEQPTGEPAWVKSMREVRGRFTGTPGTLATFGDSITVSMAFWAPLRGDPKGMSDEMALAHKRVKEYMHSKCWVEWKGPQFGNNGSMTIRWARENVDQWLKDHNPEVAVIMFGSNDVGELRLAEFERQTAEVVDRCLKNGTVTILTTLPPRSGLLDKSKEFAEAVRRIAKDKRVPLIDYQAEILKRRPDDWDGALPKFKDVPGSEYEVPTLIARDGVHPSNPAKHQDFSEESLSCNGYALRNYLTLLAYAHVIKSSAEPAALDAAFEFVEAAVAKGEIPGAIALVSKWGKIVREQAYGLADVEQKIPFTPRTICWVASITKPVTVAAAMKLVEDGRLGLDDPVDKYLPEFAELKDKDGRRHAITIRQLMCHTSGLQPNPPLRPSFFFEQEFLGRKIGDVAATIAQTPLQFQPGSQTQYSNAAPYVLARVIELRSGKLFHEHVQQTILGPAGMRDSYFIIPVTEAKRSAVVYRDTKDERVVFFRFNSEWKVTMTLPDGGLFSSPREIARFLQVFLDDDGSVLAKSSVKAMRERQTDGWGLGWALEENGSFHHSGSSGVSAWADPKTGVVGVLFCQLQNPDKVSPLQARFRQSVREAFSAP